MLAFLAFMRGLKKKLSKKSKGGRARKLLARLAVLPVCFVLALLICFFAFDDFTLLFLAGANNLERNYNRSAGAGVPTDWDTAWGGSDFTGEMPDYDGVVGLGGMQINSAKAGFYSEFLRIVRDHANWSMMHPEAEPLLKDDEPVYPNIGFLLGLQLSESTAENKPKNEWGLRIAPVSVMSGSVWQDDGKHTLSAFNSAVAAEEGLASLDSGYTNLSLQWGDDWTHFQFLNRGVAAIYPTGRVAEQAQYWPSRMNPYGIAADKLRTRADTDAAYLPDMLSVVLQHSWTIMERTGYAIDTLTQSGLETAAYPAYNYGASGWQRSYGCGTKSGSSVYSAAGWSSKNTITYQQNAAYSINWLGSLIDAFLEKFTQDYDSYAGDKSLWGPQLGGSHPDGPINQRDYEGIADITVLMNGGFTSHSSAALIKERFEGAGYQRGAIIAYRVWTGDKDATADTVRNWINTKMPVKDPDSSVYPDYNDTKVYYIDTEAPKIYRNDGSGPVAPLRAYDTSYRGTFIARVGGVMMYWRMLLASGVEITLADAYKDSIFGDAIDSDMAIPGNRMAHAMAMYSYGTKKEGKGNDGTPLYREVLNLVEPGSKYAQSCDRGVATATRWSGADDRIPMGSTYTQLEYFVSSNGATHWVEVDWRGDKDNLLPGDILVRSDRFERGGGAKRDGDVGHIVMFLGFEIINLYHPKDPVEDSGYAVSHASYKDRSPTCTPWYSGTKNGYGIPNGLDTFRVFRCAQDEYALDPTTHGKYYDAQLKNGVAPWK